MRSSLLLAPLVFLFSSCVFVIHDGSFSERTVRGSGERVESHRSLPEFRSIQFHTAGEVNVTVGSQTSVTLSGDDNLLAGVTTEVRGDQLVINCPDEYDFDEELRITIHTPGLERFQLGGAGEVHITGIQGSVFDLDVSGAGEIEAAGSVERLHVSVSGAGSAELRELHVRDANITISGAGEVEVTATGSLRYDISGAGAIEFSGNPEVTGRISGAGNINRR